MFFDSLTDAIKALAKEIRWFSQKTIDLTDKVNGLEVQTKFLAQEVKSLRKTLRLRMPGEVKLVVVKQENGMPTVFKLSLPEAVDADVKVGGSRKLTVSIAGGEPVETILSGDAVFSDELTGEEHDVVSGSLQDTDDDNNTGEAREFSLTIPDVTPPAQPGEVSIEIVSQT